MTHTNSTRPFPRHVARRSSALLRSAALLLMAALAACDNPAGSGEPATSSVSLVYGGSNSQGTINGRYEAEGEPAFPTAPITQTWALGQRVSGQTLLRVGSNVARTSENTADFAWVTIPRLTVGNVPILGTCPGEDCAGVSLALVVSTNVAVSQARYSCALDEGTIRVTSISDGRAKGTFSGTGSCLAAPGFQDLDQFTITDGTFDVKMIDVPS